MIEKSKVLIFPNRDLLSKYKGANMTWLCPVQSQTKYRFVQKEEFENNLSEM